MSIVLILGSGPNAVEAQSWPRNRFNDIIAINNAWRVRPDWSELIHPEDFPDDRRPIEWAANQKIITYRDYVPAQNNYGGFVYAGGTMAFTAAYWALHAHRPKVLAFIGCDMTYAAVGHTHFYGTGAADPLRADITLQSLEGKSARLMLHAAAQGCACVNLSGNDSRLIFPRAHPDALADIMPQPYIQDAMADCLAREAQLAYSVPSGRYWPIQNQFDAPSLLELDHMWLDAAVGYSTAVSAL